MKASIYKHYGFFESLTYEQKILGVSALGLLILVFGSEALVKGASNLSALILDALRIHKKSKKKDQIQIGSLVLKDEARLRHTHIVGATGSGKTVLIEQLLFNDLLRGNGAVIIDPKGDRELYDRVKLFCQKIGRERDLHLLSATHFKESKKWNPCRLGNASELQSKFFNSAIYDNAFYAKAVEHSLLRAFSNLTKDSVTETFSMIDLVKVLEGMAAESKDENIKGLYYDLNNLIQSEWRGILTGDQECVQNEYTQIECTQNDSTASEINLLEIIRRNEILFIDLPTEGKKTQSQRIGRLLLQELMLVSGLRKTLPHLKGEKPFSVYVDEFDAFATESFSTFLNKGRSSGFMIHIGHQTLSDLKLISDAFTGQIMGNTNVRFIFRQDDPDDAETWSRFFGTKTIIKRTFQTENGQMTGMSSNREAQEFRVSPDVIKDLKTGECVVSIKTDNVFKSEKIPHPDSIFKNLPEMPVIRGELKNETNKRPSFSSKNLKNSETTQKKTVKKTILEDL